MTDKSRDSERCRDVGYRFIKHFKGYDHYIGTVVKIRPGKKKKNSIVSLLRRGYWSVKFNKNKETKSLYW